MSVVIDHYNGFYPFENDSEKSETSNSLAQQFRNSRAKFKSKIENLVPKTKFQIIDEELIKYRDYLKESKPVYLEKLEEGILFNDGTINWALIHKEYNLLVASYVIFLTEHKSRLEEEERLVKLNESYLNEFVSLKAKKSIDDDVVKNKLKTVKPVSTGTIDELTCTQIGIFFNLLQKNGFINKFSDLSLSKIVNLLTNCNQDNVRTVLSNHNYEDKKFYYNGQKSTFHLEKILQFVQKFESLIEIEINKAK